MILKLRKPFSEENQLRSKRMLFSALPWRIQMYTIKQTDQVACSSSSALKSDIFINILVLIMASPAIFSKGRDLKKEPIF